MLWRDIEPGVELVAFEIDFSCDSEEVLGIAHALVMLPIEVVLVPAMEDSVAQSMRQEVELSASVVSFQQT